MLLLAGVTTAVHNLEVCFNAVIPVRHPDACTMSRSAPGSHCVLIWRKSRIGEHRSGLATEGAVCIEAVCGTEHAPALTSCTCTILPV